MLKKELKSLHNNSLLELQRASMPLSAFNYTPFVLGKGQSKNATW